MSLVPGYRRASATPPVGLWHGAAGVHHVLLVSGSRPAHESPRSL